MDDPWDGFAFYLEETCRLQAADRGLNDAMGMRFPHATKLETARTRLFELVGQVIDRAQRSRQLRADLSTEDLALVTWANARILQAGRAAGAPDAWRRHLGLLLDGFRADRVHPLPRPPLTPGRSTGRCSCLAAAPPAPRPRMTIGASSGGGPGGLAGNHSNRVTPTHPAGCQALGGIVGRSGADRGESRASDDNGLAGGVV